MSNRKMSLVSQKLAEELVKQIAHELKNRNLYLSFANYFSVQGISDLEKYYRRRAEEENNHHIWIMDYLSDGDVQFVYPLVELNTEKFEKYEDPFKLTVDREIETTELIYKIYELALEEKDYMTASWLYEKLIREQIEEENISRMAVTIIEEESDIFLRASKILSLL